MHAEGREMDFVRAELKGQVCPAKVDSVAPDDCRVVKDFRGNSKPKLEIKLLRQLEKLLRGTA